MPVSDSNANAHTHRKSQRDQIVEASPFVLNWILAVCFLILGMVIVGGVTRLTGSGLSIVEWKPLMGAIPPLSHADWLDVFGRYQSSPQYQLVNRGMTLSEFQWIFFWEYIHRLLGRLMGLVFFIPWVFFWIKGHLNTVWARRLFLGFCLGGLQAVLGWVMVASGLVDKPHVSHYRLAAHLLLAFGILAYFWKAHWDFKYERRRNAELDLAKESALTSQRKNESRPQVLKDFKALLFACNTLLALLVIQIAYGAFVAGLKAGFLYNTFPDMEGQFFPLGAWVYSPAWRNIFENPLLVQWIHRMMGWALVASVSGLWLRFRVVSKNYFNVSLTPLASVVLVQFCLGVITLISKVNLPVAVVHQVGAAIVLLTLLWTRWELKENNSPIKRPRPTNHEILKGKSIGALN